jgi:hypothetical protein
MQWYVMSKNGCQELSYGYSGTALNVDWLGTWLISKPLAPLFCMYAPATSRIVNIEMVLVFCGPRRDPRRPAQFFLTTHDNLIILRPYCAASTIKSISPTIARGAGPVDGPYIKWTD